MWQAAETKWNIENETSNYSGTGYVTAHPDQKIKTGDSEYGPKMVYNISLSGLGTYHTWIRMSAPDGGGDSIHVGLNDEPLTYGGFGMSTPPNGEWNWEYLAINVTATGTNQLEIWMREDGVRVDSLVITTNSEFVPN